MRVQVSDEAERSVLVKLKTECGYQFTSKLESMFTDIKTSRDTMQEYKARRQATSNGEDDVELAVQVCIRYPYCCLMCWLSLRSGKQEGQLLWW